MHGDHKHRYTYYSAIVYMLTKYTTVCIIYEYILTPTIVIVTG